MAFIEPRDRIVIPRWRSFERGAANSEIIILKPNLGDPLFSRDILEDKIQDWIKERSISNALELVTASYSLGLTEYATDAANFLMQSKREFSPALLKIINLVLGVGPTEYIVKPEEFDFSNFSTTIGEQIHDTRNQLRVNPHNPLLWTVLARHYSILGSIEKAAKAIDVALGQTKYSNTYIQRIASRFYYHLGEVDKALYIIRKSKDYDTDPWLVASDISYSSKLGRFNRNLTIGMKMIESTKFSARDLTELASSLGTMHLYKGSLKQARKSFDVSMWDPNENSLAQMEFVSSAVPVLHESNFAKYFSSLPNAFEARAHEFQSTGNFSQAFQEGCRWLLDQPFSKRAAIFSQFLAITHLKEFERGIEIGHFALHANPRSFEIHNNLAYAYAKRNQLTKANMHLDRMRLLLPGETHKIFLLATAGLIKIREGHFHDGKELYDEAINLASKLNQPKLKELAIYNFLTESMSSTGNIDLNYLYQIDKESNLRIEIEQSIKTTNNI